MEEGLEKCPTTGKCCYNTASDALMMVDFRRDQGIRQVPQLRTYVCPFCRRVHLTKKRKTGG